MARSPGEIIPLPHAKPGRGPLPAISFNEKSPRVGQQARGRIGQKSPVRSATITASEAVRVKVIRGAGDSRARTRNRRASKADRSSSRTPGGTGSHLGFSKRHRTWRPIGIESQSDLAPWPTQSPHAKYTTSAFEGQGRCAMQPASTTLADGLWAMHCWMSHRGDFSHDHCAP